MAKKVQQSKAEAKAQLETVLGKAVEQGKAELYNPQSHPWKDNLENAILDVPKAAKELVRKATAFLFKSLGAHAKNQIDIGIELGKVQESVSPESFTRLVNTVWYVVASKATIYRWIRNSAVLCKAVPYETAREALVVVMGSGNDIFSTEPDKTDPKGRRKVAVLSGSLAKGLIAHPVPPSGTAYDECIDWARSVQVVASRSGARIPITAGDYYKAGMERFAVLIEGNKRRNIDANYAFAVQFAFQCTRWIQGKSLPLFLSLMESVNDPSLSTREEDLTKVGKAAMHALAEAQGKPGKGPIATSTAKQVTQ